MSAAFEKSFFFSGSLNRKLYGFLHGVESKNTTIGLIYCHPFAEEKNMSHSVIVKSSRMMASKGFPVLRFDFSGCGDSEGTLADVSVEDWQYDLQAAVDVFRQETGVARYFIWGLGLGSGLALLHAAHDKGVAGLVLWQPVLDFSLHLKQFLRRAISSQIANESDRVAPGANVEDRLAKDGEVSVIGYPVSRQLYESFNNVGNSPAQIVPTVPTLILSISLLDEATPVIRKYVTTRNDKGAPVTLQHIKVEPFWDRYWRWELDVVAEQTLDWLQRLDLGEV